MSGAPIVAGRYIGQRLPRKEDQRLLTGQGAFVDDIIVPGMLHVAFVRSQIARGRIKSIDLSQARAMPGVYAALSAADLGRFNEVSLYNMHMQPGPPGVRPLSPDYVSHVGDPVAIVVAESRYLAEDAAGTVFVDYEEADPVITIGAAKDGALVHPGTESNVVAVADFPQNPELAKAFAGAAHVVTETIIHQRVSQSPMETRGVLSAPHGAGELTIYIGCQSPHVAARIFAMSFGLDQADIRVVAKDVGGGFGLKAQPWREEAAVVAASLLLKRPLKWIEDRAEALSSGYPAREQECTVRLAFDKDATLLAVDVDYASNNGAYPMQPDANMGGMMFYSGPYKFPLFGIQGRGYYTNVPETLRQGVEVGANWRWGRLSAFANYSYIDATYQFTGVLSSPNNPHANAAGNITVHPGDKIPGIPNQEVKVGADYEVLPNWTVGGDLEYIGSQNAVGDDSNQNARVTPYMLVNLRSTYQVTDKIQIFGKINNLFDRRYESYGTYFDTGGVGQPITDNLTDPRSITLGQPTAFFGGVKVTF